MSLDKTHLSKAALSSESESLASCNFPHRRTFACFSLRRAAVRRTNGSPWIHGGEVSLLMETSADPIKAVAHSFRASRARVVTASHYQFRGTRSLPRNFSRRRLRENRRGRVTACHYFIRNDFWFLELDCLLGLATRSLLDR